MCYTQRKIEDGVGALRESDDTNFLKPNGQSRNLNIYGQTPYYYFQLFDVEMRIVLVTNGPVAITGLFTTSLTQRRQIPML